MHNRKLIKRYQAGGATGGAMGKIGSIGGSGGGMSPWSAIGKAADTVGNFLPEKSAYSGDSGALAKGLDSAYDGAADAAMNFPPVGCVCAGTRVLTNEGLFINIEDLLKFQGILGWDNNTKQIKELYIYDFIKPHTKECLEIKLQSGITLRCSIDHPILCSLSGRGKETYINGKRYRVRLWEFKRADSLNIGDFAGLANEIDIWGTKEMLNPYLIGLLIGDGTYGKDHGVRMYSENKCIWDYIEKYNLGAQIKFDDINYTNEFRAYRIYNGTTQLKELGIYELTKENKTLPKDIYKYTKNSICLLIAGLFDTDGSVHCNIANKDYKVVFCQSNLKLIMEVKEQLLKLGIHSSIQTINEHISKFKQGSYLSKIYYKLIIKDKQSIINFYKNIHLNIDYKLNNLYEIYLCCLQGKFKDNRYLSGAKSDKIISIQSIGELIIYNLQAEPNHTYLANGIITHNTMIGGIMKGAGLINKGISALGGGTDGMTGVDAFMDSNVGHAVMGGLGPGGLLFSFLNGFLGKKAETFTKDKQLFAEMGSSYGGANSLADTASHYSGKKYGLLSAGARHRANAKIEEAKRLLGTLSNIQQENEQLQMLSGTMTDTFNNAYANKLQGGYNQSDIHSAKHGAKLEKTMDLNEWLNFYQLLTPIEDIDSFKKGGQLNVIPEGALHKNKHHLEDVNEDLDGEITHKGIPVVSIKDDGTVELLAEIENNEIIFNLEVTQQIEDLRKLYKEETSPSKKDEIARQAGEILSNSIIEDTDDKTGLLKQINDD